MAPKQERLHELFMQHQNELDGGFFEALTTFAEECFIELKSHGDKATPGLLHSFIVAAYKEGQSRR